MSTATTDKLSKVLATSYALYLKTQNFHWNVKGPMFKALHDLFELQYTELATAIDEIAERIRALGGIAPGSFEQFSSLSEVKDTTDTPDANGMIKILLADNKTMVETAKTCLKEAESAGDEVTTDMMVQRMTVHDKTAWMLQSML